MSDHWRVDDDPDDSWYRYRIYDQNDNLIANIRSKSDDGREAAERIVRDHNEAAKVRAVGLKLETLAAIARAIGQDAQKLETALRRFDATTADQEAPRV